MDPEVSGQTQVRTRYSDSNSSWERAARGAARASLAGALVGIGFGCVWPFILIAANAIAQAQLPHRWVIGFAMIAGIIMALIFGLSGALGGGIGGAVAGAAGSKRHGRMLAAVCGAIVGAASGLAAAAIGIGIQPWQVKDHRMC